MFINFSMDYFKHSTGELTECYWLASQVVLKVALARMQVIIKRGIKSIMPTGELCYISIHLRKLFQEIIA